MQKHSTPGLDRNKDHNGIDNYGLHTVTMDACPLESSPLETQGVFTQGKTLAQNIEMKD